MIVDILKVGEAIELINDTLSAAMPAVLVEGEVSSYSVNQGKYVFFDIKDDMGSMSCFMMLFNQKLPIADGMMVRVLAYPKITNKGKFSLTIKQIQPVGEGSIKKSLNILRSKLEAEGIFSDSRKRALPRIPNRIGVVSSSGAAGYKDFIKILENRWGSLEVVLVDVAVQGVESPPQIVNAIKYLNNMELPVEAIAIIRGGGSIDDLSTFSREDVVRAIAGSAVPVITGIGHETDVSLSDLVADVRASTPSNAAEIIVPSKDEIMTRAKRLVEMANNGVNAAVSVCEEDYISMKMLIEKRIDEFMDNIEQRHNSFKSTLYQLSPEAVLRRGYALVVRDGAVVDSVQSISVDEDIEIKLKDGNMGARIKYVK